MALPTAIFATVASLSLAGVAVMSSVDVQQGTRRDSDSKSAIAAADAGANVALLRLNRYASALSSSTPCLGLSGSTLVVTAASKDGWCPEVTGTVGSSTYAYRVTPKTGSTMSVVATGSDGTVSRRIDITFNATTVGSAFSNEGLIGQESITLDNNADVRVGLGTNGDVNLANNANVCGSIRHGIGKKANLDNNATQCKGYSITEGNVSLPAVSTFIPSDIATNNSNSRLVACTKPNVPANCELDTYDAKRNSTEPWDSATRTISTSNNSTLSLGGSDYFICKLVLNNNVQLIMTNTAHVRVFFDTPENCKLSAGARQIEVQNNATIKATGYQPSLKQFDMPGFYLLGSSSISTTAYWSNNAGGAEMVLYGPNTAIDFNNNATFIGAIAGKSIHLANNSIVKQDAGVDAPPIGGATLYSRQSYVECTGASASPPNANC